MKISTHYRNTASAAQVEFPSTQSPFGKSILRLRSPLEKDTVQVRFSGIFQLPKLEANIVNGVNLGYVGPNSKPMPMSQELQKSFIPEGKKIVTWPVFAISPKTEPLQTYGMERCSALKIDSPDNEHYLLHLNPSQDVEDIKKHFMQDIPWRLADDKTTLELIPGVSRSTYLTVYNILEALHDIDSALIEKVQFRHYPDEAARYGANHDIEHSISVVSYLSKLLCHPVSNPFLRFQPGGDPIRPHIIPIANFAKVI